MTDIDIINLQWMAARYAHDRMTFAAETINSITLRMLKRGIYPQVDPPNVRGSPEPTIWAKDRALGWPEDLIEAYGWDGKKVRKIAHRSTRDMTRNELLEYVDELRMALASVSRSTRTDTIGQGDSHDPQAGQQVRRQK